MKVHYTDPYLLNPQHKITINLIGAGGTGSQVLSCLGRLNQTLMALDHPGIHVYLWDADTVTEANIGRQLFSSADIGMNKAICLITRVNRFFGSDWVAVPEMFVLGHTAKNITISCVDTAAARIKLAYALSKGPKSSDPVHKEIYWLDFGNSKRSGQVILGTCGYLKQPKKSDFEIVSKLKNVVEFFPNLKKIKEKDQGPSCSIAEAISKQDLFINSTLAQLGCDLLWKLFRTGMITIHGLYLNLETMIVNPIKIS